MGKRPVKVGVCLMWHEDLESGKAARWNEIKAHAVAAEQIGFDTVWVPDELLWGFTNPSGRRGWWECVAIAGAVAASTSRVAVGTWVMAGNYRNPALAAKIVETLDEISAGRFILGIGAGAGDREAEAFGYPKDHVYSRFEEALEILVPLLRAGKADHHGTYFQAVDLELRPRGPRPGKIPLMIGAHGPKMMRLAAKHADIWSGYATEGSKPKTLAPLLDAFSTTCEVVGRDPASIGRSLGVVVEPTKATGAAAAGYGEPIRGSAQEIAEAIAEFGALGVTQIELIPWPLTLASIEALSPVVAALDRA